MEGYFSANILGIYVERVAWVIYHMGWEHGAVGTIDFIALLVVPNVAIVHSVHSVDHPKSFDVTRSRVYRDAILVDTIFLQEKRAFYITHD